MFWLSNYHGWAQCRRVAHSAIASVPLCIHVQVEKSALQVGRLDHIAQLLRGLSRSLWFSSLCAVPDSTDHYPCPLDAIENDIGRAADDQLADTRTRAGASEARMVPERFNHSNDARGQTFRCFRLVQSHIGANLSKTLERPRRPDNLHRVRAFWLVWSPAR